MSKNRTIAIIVTYSNRHDYCTQVIKGCIKSGVEKIIVVDNGSSKISSIKYSNLEKTNKKLKILKLNENLGAAGGYYIGLEYVYKLKNFDFVWLLDDDLVPYKDALNKLKLAFNLLRPTNIQSNIFESVLYSFRGELWELDKEVVQEGMIKEYKKNNFMGFNLFSWINKNFLKTKKKYNQLNYPITRVKFGPFGGLFTKISTIKKIGLPQKKLFYAGDDIDFTLRFNKKKIDQFLVYNSKMNEIDKTNQSKIKYFFEEFEDYKVICNIRNHTYICQNYRKNEFIYLINKFFWIFGMLLFSFPLVFSNAKLFIQRWSLILKSIRDGEKGKIYFPKN